MKKAGLCIVVMLSLLTLTACEIKAYTPEVPTEFKQNALVTSGDFSFECEICRNLTETVVTVTSTNAAGLTMTYDGSEICFSYGDYSYNINADNFEKSNTAEVVYEVIEELASGRVTGRKIDGGYKYEGSVDFGQFVLVQNDDNSLASIAFKQNGYTVKFK